jgi:hypothetical protein
MNMSVMRKRRKSIPENAIHAKDTSSTTPNKNYVKFHATAKIGT